MAGSKQVEIRDIRHLKICSSKDTYCGHPRQGGILNFGNGEIALIHNHAPCAYRVKEDVQHDYFGYHRRATYLLQRSFDGGETWPESGNVEVFRECDPIEKRREFIAQYSETAERDDISLASPDTCTFFRVTYVGEADNRGMPAPVLFCLRSPDRGRTWERVPTVIRPAHGYVGINRHNPRITKIPDGTFLASFSCVLPGEPSAEETFGARFTTAAIAVYGTDDDGLSWTLLSEVHRDPTGQGRPGYPTLLRLQSGRLQCYMLNIYGQHNAMMMSESEDAYAWSSPRPIVRWGHSPWRKRRRPGQVGGYFHYRSPWPLLLDDGRIVVIFGRRKAPYGIGGIVSEDQGRTWSDEFVLRDDCSGPDLGYPVATQLDDGRIFTAYYMTIEDGNAFGGSRHIAGTFFRLS